MLSLPPLLHTGQTGPDVVGNYDQETMVTQTKWPNPSEDHKKKKVEKKERIRTTS